MANYFKLNLLIILVVVILHKTNSQVKHGSAFVIRSKYDNGIITAGPYQFSKEIGIYLGELYLKHTKDTSIFSNQIWDFIKWEQKGDNFWVVPRAFSLNKLTVIPPKEAEARLVQKPAKNLVQFIPVNSYSGSNEYMIKSLESNLCLHNPIMSEKSIPYVIYAECKDEPEATDIWIFDSVLGN